MPCINTPTGTISWLEEDGCITHLQWGDKYKQSPSSQTVSSELEGYFKGQVKEFSVSIQAKGTPFQQKVWRYLLTIPYGTVQTYKQVADAVGSHPRAVGGAVGKNPIPLIIPCHRVVGSNGTLTGFSGGNGISTKEQLLNLEQKFK